MISDRILELKKVVNESDASNEQKIDINISINKLISEIMKREVVEND